jgi:cytochrome c5
MRYVMPRLSLLLAAVLLTACSKPPAPQPFEDAAITDLGKARWARTCALCHVNGEGGAPRFGDRDAWAPRLAQGEDVLLDHTINGYNNMPPLGYCMDCEREDLRAYIRFMTAGAGT